MKFKLLTFLPLFLLFGCIDNGNDENCKEIACTEIFVFLTVKVVDTNGEPVSLDNYKVILTQTGVDITPEDSDGQFSNEDGTYVVFSDKYANEYQNKTTTIRFSGFVESEEVVSSEFIVGADCCHVKMISDSNVITIN